MSEDAPYVPPLPPVAVEPLPPEEPILPAAYSPADLRDAVGAHVRTPKHEDPDAPKRKRGTLVAVLALAVGLVVATLIFLGRANGERRALVCEADRMTPMRGRAFPPWGMRALDGAEWAPLHLAANGECSPQETDDEHQLGTWYLDAIVKHADAALEPHGGTVDATKLDPIDAELHQAQFLAHDPTRRAQRDTVDHLLGDVAYWRAAAKIRDAAAALDDAAKQFDAAAAQLPVHVANGGVWAAWARKASSSLRGGPGSEPTPGPAAPIAPPPMPERPTAPLGTALPVEAPTPAGSASAPAPVAPPSGGVLL
ncbi:MAG TPA: hypothetical protein VGM88_23235 [Kofleriaceae bacterium]